MEPESDNIDIDIYYNNTDDYIKKDRDHHDNVDKIVSNKIKKIEPIGKVKAQDISNNKATLYSPYKINLSGAITAIENNGEEYCNENGIIEFVIGKKKFNGISGGIYQANVFNGVWSIEVLFYKEPSNIGFKLNGALLGGRLAFPEYENIYFINENKYQSLRVKWITTPILHVVASDFETELDLIQIVYKMGIKYIPIAAHEKDHPKNYIVQEFLRSARSPINMLSANKNCAGVWIGGNYFIRAPGYAWKRIEIDVRKRSENILHLKPGGNLDVTIKGYKNDKKVELRIRKSDYDYPDYVFGIKRNGKMEIESIETGKYIVRAEMGDAITNALIPGSGPLILAEENVEVFKAQKTSLSLILNHVNKIKTVPFSGTITIPDSWNMKNVSMQIDFLGTPINDTPISIYFSNKRDERVNDNYEDIRSHELVPIKNKKGVFSWDAGLVQPGEYNINILNYDTIVKVGKEGNTDANICLPDMEDVSIQIVDLVSRRIIDVNEIRVIRIVDKSSHYTSFVKKNKNTESFNFKAPVGKIKIEIVDFEYQVVVGETNNIINIYTGYNSYIINAINACGFDLILEDKGIPIDQEISNIEMINTKSGETLYCYTKRNNNGWRIKVRKPGIYKFKIVNINGYLPIKEQTIQIIEGIYIKHVINMQKDN